MQILLQRLRSDYPQFRFVAGDVFHWSPSKQAITYTTCSSHDIYSLLHEVGHALLQHKSYSSDADLLQKELAAWEKAKKLAIKYGDKIDDDFVENCLDSYRDWIYKRSRCPSCTMQGVQTESERYNCPNCHTSWSVSDDRLCRPYRRSHTNSRAHIL